MTTPNFAADWEKLNAISLAIVQSNRFAALRFSYKDAGRWPHWYLNLVSRLRAVVQGSPVLYVTSTVGADPEPTGEVVLFTDKLVVKAAVTPPSDPKAEPALTTKVWRRVELTDLTIDDIDSYPPSKRGFEQSWPEAIVITLTYPGRPALRVPLDGHSGSDGAATLAQVYTSLIADLSATDVR